MEEKYGKKVATLQTQGMIYLPTVMVTILFAAVFFGMLVSGLRSETGPMWAVIIIAGIGMIVAAVVLVMQATKINLVIYENYLVQNNLFGKREINAEDIRAMIWQFPGPNPINPRGARINNTSAEILFKDGSKSIKVQDSYYKNFEKELGAFQRSHNIPSDLEKKKKGGNRYD